MPTPATTYYSSLSDVLRKAGAIVDPASLDCHAAPCSRCNGAGKAFAYADGCATEQRPVRHDDHESSVEPCRSCESVPVAADEFADRPLTEAERAGIPAVFAGMRAKAVSP
jgi:hypothetical protein